MKVIRCPHCQSICAIGGGYYHDEKLNIRCKSCHKVMLATNEEDEQDLQKLHTRPILERHDHIHHVPHGTTFGAAYDKHHRGVHHGRMPSQNIGGDEDGEGYD